MVIVNIPKRHLDYKMLQSSFLLFCNSINVLKSKSNVFEDRKLGSLVVGSIGISKF